ncbi:MAG TPA: type II toxin-antitoxin system RelE/ParE family toxin [Candidatus Methanoperedens sp.]|nr:type II toxin-antitoxin system RelE/ParE family toxin [Candidatus Methanoperedens sp.]
MTRKTRILPSADRDIDEQIAYISRENPDAAGRYVEAVSAILEHMVRMPGMGATRDYRNPRLSGLRMIPVPGFDNFLVFYLVTPRTVDIVRVLHSARDIRTVFTKFT